MKITVKKLGILSLILLGIAIVAVALLHLYMARFNSRNRVLKLSESACDEFVEFSVKVTGNWEKIIAKNQNIMHPEYFAGNGFPEDEAGNTKTFGKTYDFTLKNISDASIAEWYVVIKIPEDTFLNKSWNGEVEFHQNHSKKVQTFNPLKVNKDELQLDWFEVDGLLMFPLEKNSVIVYHPSEEYFETPVSASSPEENSYYSKTFGMIFYSHIPELNFTDCEIHYKIRKKLYNMNGFWIFMTLFVAIMITELLLFVHIVVAARYERKRRHDKDIIIQAIGTFSQFIDARDKYTRHHSLRVAHYSKMIAGAMGMNEEFMDMIFYIGLLHDTGKVNISDEILNKPGKLSDEEYEEIKTHTTKGSEILKGFTAIDNLIEGVLCHHERFDGTGYPLGLRGEQIPFVSRIIAVADSFDAMSSNRCYRRHLSDEEIIDELNSKKGTQFDANVVDAFIKAFNSPEFEKTNQNIIREIRLLS